MIYRFQTSQFLPVNSETLWAFISNPENLASLTPDRMNIKFLHGQDRPMYAGQMLHMSVTPIPGFRSTWVSEITQLEEGHYFVDEQRSGPYRMWHHQHIIHSVEGGVQMEDIVHYQVPYGWLDRLLHPIFIKPQLKKIFDYRQAKLNSVFT